MKNMVLALLFFLFTSNLLSADKIKALMPSSFLPYFTIDKNGKPAGFAVEVLNEIAKDANYEIDYIIKPNYVNVEEAYLSNEGDLIVASGISEKRKEVSIFTDPISSLHIKAYKRTDFDINSLDEIKNHRLILKTNNITVSLFKDQKKDKVRFVDSKEEGLLSLFTGQGDVFVFNDYPLEKLIKQLAFEDKISSFGENIHQVDFAIRIQKDKINIQKRLNDSLIKFKTTKKYQYLYNKWILDKVVEEPKEEINFTEEEKQWIQEHPTLTVGHSSKFEPLFIKTPNGKFEGVIPEIYKLLEDKIGVKFKYIEDNWFNIHKRVFNNEIDIVGMMNDKAVKQKNLLEIDKFFTYPFTIFSKKNDKRQINSMEDLKGLKVAYYKEIIVVDEYLKDFKGIDTLKVNSPIEAFQAVLNNKADVAISFEMHSYLLNKYSILGLKVSHYLKEGFTHWVPAVASNSLILQSILSKAIKTINIEDHNKILSKWSYRNEDLRKVYNLSNDEFLFLQNKKDFTVCTQYNSYPVSAVLNKELIGVTGDLFKKISNKLEINFKAIDVSSNEDLNKKVKKEKCDFVSIVIQNQKRFKNIKPSQTFSAYPFSIVGNLNQEFVGNPIALKDATILVRFGIYKELIRKTYPYLNVVVENDLDKAMEKVSKNNNFYISSIEPNSNNYITRYGFDKFKVTALLPNTVFESAIGINENLPQMQTIINKVLDTFTEKEIDDIYNKYEIKEYKVNVDYKYLWFIFFISLIIITLIYMKYFFNKKQKERIEQLNKKLNVATNSASLGVWEWDIKNEILIWNDLMYEIYEIEPNTSTNRYDLWKNALDSDCKKRAEKEIFQALENHTIFDTEFKINTKSGIKYIDAYGKATYDKNGNAINMIGINIDISEKKKLIEELSTKNKALEHAQVEIKNSLFKANYEKEKAQSAYEEASVAEEEAISSQRELINMHEQLIKASKSKSDFLANMSHEIRTPLSGIMGITDIMLEDDCSASQERYLSIIKKSSISLKNIINDILDFTKIEEGKFDIINRPFNLEKMIDSIKDMFKVNLNHRNVEFKLFIQNGIPNNIIGDELRVTQILNNIIGNSLKFTEKGYIKLSIRELSRRRNLLKLKFMIEDTGIGMSEEITNIIFESFTQGELSNTKKYQGTGLGLSISKNLVELMGGKIWFDSVQGQGTTFYFTIDFRIDKNKKEEEIIINQELNVLKEKKNALVAEDSKVNQIVINGLLTKYGFNVDIANDGEEALELAKTRKYDIIFMDIQMPKLDGHEATRYIRQFDIDIPIVAVSAAVLPEDKENSLNAGMDNHIRKPIDNIELLNEIAKYFELTKKEKKEKKSTINSLNLKFIALNSLLKDLSLEENEAFLLLQSFVKSNKNFDTKIKGLAFNSKEFKAMIHKLKGSCGNLKVEELYSLCVDIEESKIEFLSVPLNLLIDRLNEFIKEIEEKVVPLIKKDIVKEEVLKEHITSLIDDLDNFKFIKEQRFLTLYDSLEGIINIEVIQDLKDSRKNSLNDETIRLLENILSELKKDE